MFIADISLLINITEERLWYRRAIRCCFMVWSRL